MSVFFQELLSTICCQTSLNLMWKRGIQSEWLKIACGLFCPFIIPFLVRFQGLGYHSDNMTKYQKLKIFFRAPVVTFMTHVVSKDVLGLRHTVYTVIKTMYTLYCNEYNTYCIYCNNNDAYCKL